MSDTYDIVIIGGGPAGCSTALHLLQNNGKLAKRCILFDKDIHPRDKLCGGAITLNTENLLSDLGIEITIPYAPITHSSFHYGGVKIDLPDDGVAKKVVYRPDFDCMVINAVKERGFDVREGVKVNEVVRQNGNFLVRTTQGECTAKAVVGADGMGAILRKEPGFGPRNQISRLWMTDRPVDPNTNPVFQEQMLYLDLTYTRYGAMGYYWEFPCYINGQPHTNHGIVDCNQDRKTRVDGLALLKRILDERGVSIEGRPIKSHPMRHYNHKEPFSQPGMLMVGDSVGSEKLFSEGISQAMHMGRLAAQSLIMGFGRNDLTFSDYDKRVRRSRLGREMRFLNLTSKIVWSRYLELFISALHGEKRIQEMLAYSYAGKENIADQFGSVLYLLSKHLLLLGPRLRKLRRLAGLPRAKDSATGGDASAMKEVA